MTFFDRWAAGDGLEGGAIIAVWSSSVRPWLVRVGLMSQHHPSALRNRGDIADGLLAVCGAHAPALAAAATAAQADDGSKLKVFEAASGTGAHVECFAERFPGLLFQPSEYVVPDEKAAGDIGRIGTRDGPVLDVIDAVGVAKFENVLPAIAVDLGVPSFSAWPEALQAGAGTFSLVFASNVTHITPLACTEGLIEGAAALLTTTGEGLLVIYGPFKDENGAFIGPENGSSNRRFDESLQSRNPAWGYRGVEDIKAMGARFGFEMVERKLMPANNFMLALRRLPEQGEAKDGEMDAFEAMMMQGAVDAAT